MSNELYDHQPMKKDTTEFELEPRAASPSGTAPEARKDTAELGSPPTGIDNDNDQTGMMLSKDPGSTGESAQPAPNESRVPRSIGPQSLWNQEIVDENAYAPDLTDKTLLLRIRGLLVHRLQSPSLRGIKLFADGRWIRGFESKWVHDAYGVDSTEIVDPCWRWGTSINDCWPESRDVAGVRQYIIESDGVTTKAQVHWLPTWLSPIQDPNTPYDTFESMWLGWCYAARNKLHQEMPGTVDNSYSDSRHRFKGKIVYCVLDKFRQNTQGFPISLLACALSFEEPFRLSGGELDHFDVGKSTSLLSTNFRGGYSVQFNHPLQSIIHWQIRYFSPIYEYEESGDKCLFSQREKLTIQHGLDKTLLQEKRAVVSFRVLRHDPGLFSILVLKDEDMSSDVQPPDQQFDVETVWKGYGFLDQNEVTPLTYFLLEICRAFEMCMDAWEDTLSAIDKLVLVKLEDLDNLERVEELMFDNSFKRSKDYFVALQILRIIDEWVDEVQSTVEDMSKDHVILKASLWGDESRSDKSLEIAVRYVNEHVAATKSRVRKKQEEINSLRDGLFNATSLRESTKAMALNQAIYVFTVVTVLFTPVSFLATFWALPFLNNPAEGSDTIPEPSAFRNSFIIMPILTYALVIGVAWVVGQRNSARALLDLLREYWERSRSFIRFA